MNIPGFPKAHAAATPQSGGQLVGAVDTISMDAAQEPASALLVVGARDAPSGYPGIWIAALATAGAGGGRIGIDHRVEVCRRD